jgi:hypothetical protein
MNDQPISDEQRKAFAELIKHQQKRYGDRYGEYLKSLRQEWGPRIDGMSKARRVMDDIRNLRSKISDAAEHLRRMGFRVVDDGLISVDLESVGGDRKDMEEAIKAAEIERDQQDATFRRAFFDLWSTKSVDEAREIVGRFS